MLQLLKTLWDKFYSYLAKQTAESSQQISLFAVVMMINFPLFALVAYWQHGLSFEEFVVRSAGFLICLLLATYRFWPGIMIHFLPLVWYLALLTALPFFFLLPNTISSWCFYLVIKMYSRCLFFIFGNTRIGLIDCFIPWSRTSFCLLPVYCGAHF